MSESGHFRSWRSPALVREISTLFGDPRPPGIVREKQFDGRQAELAALARKPWSEIAQPDWSCYLLDLVYVRPLQPDLLQYLFPGFLAVWLEGLAIGDGRPYPDFYRALYKGGAWEVLGLAMTQRVFQWMVKAYVHAVDLWSDNFAWESSVGSAGPYYYMEVFHALGQSVPLTPALLEALSDVRTSGRAQFWFVLATTLAYREHEAPWTSYQRGWGPYEEAPQGGVHTHSVAEGLTDTPLLKGALTLLRAVLRPGSLKDTTQPLRDAPFLEPNLLALRSTLTVENLRRLLDESLGIAVRPSLREDILQVLAKLDGDPDVAREQIAKYVGAFS